MAITIRYKVVRTFKSDGKVYHPGDEWQPLDDERKNRRVIGRYVVVERVDRPPQKRRKAQKDDGRSE